MGRDASGLSACFHRCSVESFPEAVKRVMVQGSAGQRWLCSHAHMKSNTILFSGDAVYLLWKVSVLSYIYHFKKYVSKKCICQAGHHGTSFPNTQEAEAARSL